MNANVPKNLGRGLPLPPHPQIDPIYTVCEKWTKNLGRALPPLIWTKSKRTAIFFGKTCLTCTPGRWDRRKPVIRVSSRMEPSLGTALGKIVAREANFSATMGLVAQSQPLQWSTYVAAGHTVSFTAHLPSRGASGWRHIRTPRITEGQTILCVKSSWSKVLLNLARSTNELSSIFTMDFVLQFLTVHSIPSIIL